MKITVIKKKYLIDFVMFCGTGHFLSKIANLLCLFYDLNDFLFSRLEA